MKRSIYIALSVLAGDKLHGRKAGQQPVGTGVASRRGEPRSLGKGAGTLCTRPGRQPEAEGCPVS